MDENALSRARDLVQNSRRVVVLTGAGISTDSGIPDFRGPNGVWTTNPEAEKAATLQAYVTDAELRKRNWARLSTANPWEGIEPNDGHRALVVLQQRNVLSMLITQNVDGLHQRAGIDPDLVVEIHGTTQRARCLACDDEMPMSVVIDRVRSGEHDPQCLRCGGMLKSAAISFGQPLVSRDLERAHEAAGRCDLMLAIGTTLSVYPIANVVPLAVTAGADLVIVNAEPTMLDSLATEVLHTSISDTLPTLLEA